MKKKPSFKSLVPFIHKKKKKIGKKNLGLFKIKLLPIYLPEKRSLFQVTGMMLSQINI